MHFALENGIRAGNNVKGTLTKSHMKKLKKVAANATSSNRIYKTILSESLCAETPRNLESLQFYISMQKIVPIISIIILERC